MNVLWYQVVSFRICGLCIGDSWRKSVIFDSEVCEYPSSGGTRGYMNCGSLVFNGSSMELMRAIWGRICSEWNDTWAGIIITLLFKYIHYSLHNYNDSYIFVKYLLESFKIFIKIFIEYANKFLNNYTCNLLYSCVLIMKWK